MSEKFDIWDWIWQLAFASFVLFLIATIVSYVLPKITDIGNLGWLTTYPYQQYTFPLGICTFVFLLIGIGSLGISLQKDPETSVATTKAVQNKTSATFKYCPNCSKELPKGNYDFCPYCGKSLSLG
jgi:zinc-ribbon domain